MKIVDCRYQRRRQVKRHFLYPQDSLESIHGDIPSVLEHPPEGFVRALVSEKLDNSCNNSTNAYSIDVERVLDADCMET